MILLRRDSRLSSRDTRLSRRESRLERNETRGGNLLLSGTVEAATIDVFEAKEQSARKRIKFHVDDTAGQSDSEGTLTYIKSVMSE